MRISTDAGRRAGREEQRTMSARRRRPATLAAILGLTALAGAAWAQDRPAASPKGHYAALDALPDWGGVWALDFSAAGGPPPVPALKGKYLKDYEAWKALAAKSNGVTPDAGSHCLPPGMPIMMTSIPQYPIEFIFSPGRVTVLMEAWMQWRRIFTDGRGHGDDPEPSFEGESVGHWDGQTLVVDTVAIKDAAPLGFGTGHSDKLHLVERIHLAEGNPDLLRVEMTVDDPEALEHPYSTVSTFKRDRGGDLLEFVCAENDRNPVDGNGATKFIP